MGWRAEIARGGGDDLACGAIRGPKVPMVLPRKTPEQTGASEGPESRAPAGWVVAVAFAALAVFVVIGIIRRIRRAHAWRSPRDSGGDAS